MNNTLTNHISSAPVADTSIITNTLSVQKLLMPIIENDNDNVSSSYKIHEKSIESFSKALERDNISPEERVHIINAIAYCNDKAEKTDIRKKRYNLISIVISIGGSIALSIAAKKFFIK